MKTILTATMWFAVGLMVGLLVLVVSAAPDEKTFLIGLRDTINARIALIDAIPAPITPVLPPIPPPTPLPPPPAPIPPPPPPAPPTEPNNTELPDTWTSAEYFRITTPGSYYSPDVSFNAYLDYFWGTYSKYPGHGTGVFLRYQSQYHLYLAYFGMNNGNVSIKKKCPGGSSNNGTYYDLANQRHDPMPTGRDVKVLAQILDNPDGSVQINLFRDGELIISGKDNGIGKCAPIKSSGKVGIRSDAARFHFTDFQVQ